MSSRLKVLVAIVALALVSVPFVGHDAMAALTESQIQSILSLLSSFGADQATVDNVNSALRGQPTTGTPSTGTTCAFTRSLTVGVTGDDVLCLQQYLNAAGFTVATAGAGSPGNETRFFGSLTQNAVARWQAANNVSPSVGFFGPISRAKYQELQASQPGDGGDGGTTQPPAQAGTVSVSLASDNPASSTIIADDASGVAQIAAPFLSVRFTAPSNGAVTVRTLKFKRVGVSADSDLLNTWLYDGTERVAIGGSISGGVVTFNNANGIFTVDAGQSKVITLRGDLKENIGAGKTLGFDLVSASDITTSGATVNGTFPLKGNLMTTADTSDLGYVTLASYSTPSSDDTSLTPQSDVELWKMNMTANDQGVDVVRMLLTKVGSAPQGSLKNIRLITGGTTLATVDQMNSDFEVLFDLSASPFRIEKGQTKVLSIRADVVAGSGRDLKFTLQQQDDVLARDTNYGVYVNVNSSATQTWSIIQPDGDWLIASGSLAVSKSTDSPSGDVSIDATNVLFARYDFTASGEDVKVSNLKVAADTSSSGSGLDNGRVLLNGIQVGATTDIGEYFSATTTYTFGSSFIVKAGETAKVEIWADAKTTAAASLTAGETVQIYLETGSSNGQGQNSLTTVNVPTSNTSANSLTVRSGALTIAEHSAFGAQTVVAGSTNVKMGAFTLTAGAAEGVDVDSITIALGTDEDDDVQNMYLKMDGAQIGTTKTSPSTSNLYSVSISIGAGGSKLVEIFADTKSDATGTWNANVDATAIGKISSQSIDPTARTIQTMTFGTGSLTATLDASSPDADIIVAQGTNVPMTAVKFTATTESFTVKKLTFQVASNTADNISSVVLEYKDSAGNTQTKSTFMDINERAVFTDLSMHVPADGHSVATVKANLGTIGQTGSGADSGDEFSIDFDVNGDFEAISASGTTDTDAINGTPVAITADVAGNDMVVRKTRPIVVWEALPSTTLVAGDQWVAKFTVQADAKGSVAWSRLGIDVSLSDADGGGELRFGNTGGDSLRIFKETDLSNTLSASATSATTTNPIKMDLTSEEVVAAGGSKTYRVKMYNILGVETNDAIVVKVTSPYTTTVTGTWSAVAANENAFVWSDNASTSHSFTTYDWANAEFVKTLPSSSWVLTQ